MPSRCVVGWIGREDIVPGARTFGEVATHTRAVDGSVEPHRYSLLDAGDGRRLERFGRWIVDRPSAVAGGPRQAPGAWSEAALRFEPGNGWNDRRPVDERWPVELARLVLECAPGPGGELGVYAEHAALVPWMEVRIAERCGADAPPSVLHLFAHTGLLTLAAVRAGAAVAHVDASKPAVTRARANAAANGLADAPVRWLVDDALAFVAREDRRGRRYDGVIADPPSFGHGPAGRRWEIERDLPVLLDGIRAILAPGGFVLVTAHTTGLDEDRLADVVSRGLRRPFGDVERGRLTLDAASGAHLDLGAYARLTA